MPYLPPRDRRAKTGHNIPARKGKINVYSSPPEIPALLTLQENFHRQRAALVRKPQRRAAVVIGREVAAAWQQASLENGADGSARAESKLAARARLDREYLRAIPCYAPMRKLARKFRQQSQKIAMQHQRPALDGARLAIGPVRWPTPVDPVHSYSFPFPRFALDAFEFGGAHLMQENSFIWPDTGQIIQNFTFEHNESDWGLQSNSHWINHYASCGVDFTMPRDGRLQVGAEVVNLYNRLNCSISDNFGFSHSYLQMSVELFISFVREGQPPDNHVAPLLTTYLESDGDDVSRSFSDLANEQPYGIGAATLFPIPAGEKLSVLVGAHVRISSDTDDMDAHVRATYWWRLLRMTIGLL